MDQLRQAIQDALREAERLSQPEPAPMRRVAYPLEQPLEQRLEPQLGQRRPATIDREGQDAEPEDQRAMRAMRAKEAPPPPVVPAPAPPSDLRAILRSRVALRQAFFLREILGPPRALQGPDGDGRI